MTATGDYPTHVPPVESIVFGLTYQNTNELVAALVEREDTAMDLLRLAAQQFGAMPEITAEVIASIGLGSPLDPVQREFIRRQYVNKMNELREQYGQDNT